MADLTFDFTPVMGSDSADRLSYALRNTSEWDAVHVRVSAADTTRVGPVLQVLEKRGYECHTKGDAGGGLAVTGRYRKA